MASQQDFTTLVCLFHHQEQAQAAVNDLLKAGLPDDSISLIGGPHAVGDSYEDESLAALGMPRKDLDHLHEGIRKGGIVVAVASIADHVDKVEDIFEAHQAEKIDEADTDEDDFDTSALTAETVPATGVTAPWASVRDDAAPAVISEPVAMNPTLSAEGTEIVSDDPTEYQGDVRIYQVVAMLNGEPVVEEVALNDVTTAHRDSTTP